MTPEEKRRRWLSDLASVMKTREGRRAIYTILGEGCRVEESVIPGPFSEVRKLVPEEGWVYYLAGKRDVGNWLRSELLEACPEDTQRMHQEGQEQMLTDLLEARRRRKGASQRDEGERDANA